MCVAINKHKNCRIHDVCFFNRKSFSIHMLIYYTIYKKNIFDKIKKEKWKNVSDWKNNHVFLYYWWSYELCKKIYLKKNSKSETI